MKKSFIILCTLLIGLSCSAASYLGMKQPQYYRYENGLRDIPSDILIKIADYYNVSTDYILGRTNNPKLNEWYLTRNDYRFLNFTICVYMSKICKQYS